MDKVNILGQMEEYTKANIKKTKEMEKVNILGQMEDFTKAYLKTVEHVKVN